MHQHPVIATQRIIEDRLEELEEYKQKCNEIPTATYEQLQHRLELLDRMLLLRKMNRDLQKLYEGRL